MLTFVRQFSEVCIINYYPNRLSTELSCSVAITDRTMHLVLS